MNFLPSQSVNDLRYHNANGVNVNGTVMTYIIEPSEAPGPALPPSAVVWTAP